MEVRCVDLSEPSSSLLGELLSSSPRVEPRGEPIASACAGEGGEEDEQEHHGTCLLLAASASCSQAMALTWRWRSAKYSHRRVISAAWIMRASSSSKSEIGRAHV